MTDIVIISLFIGAIAFMIIRSKKRSRRRHQSRPVQEPTNTEYTPPKPTSPGKDPLPPVTQGEPFVIDQDSWDEDNYPILTMAYNLHKAGKINLIAVVISGEDSSGAIGNIFEALTGGGIPIFYRDFDTRVTPSWGRYGEALSLSPSELKKDNQRGGTAQLASLIAGTSGKVTWITGGHVQFANAFIAEHLDVVRAKINKFVLSTGWTSHTSGAQETNFSATKAIGKATKQFFERAHNEVDVVLTPLMNYQSKSGTSLTSLNKQLLNNVVSRGPYFKDKGNVITLGDSDAFFIGTRYNNGKGYELQNVNVHVGNNGAVKVAGRGNSRVYIAKRTRDDHFYVQMFRDLINS